VRTVELPIHLVRKLEPRDLVTLREYLSRERQFSTDGLRAIRERLAEHYARRLGIGVPADPGAFLSELYLCLRDERSRL
jgi:hypothetical protein